VIERLLGNLLLVHLVLLRFNSSCLPTTASSDQVLPLLELLHLSITAFYCLVLYDQHFCWRHLEVFVESFRSSRELNFTHTLEHFWVNIPASLNSIRFCMLVFGKMDWLGMVQRNRIFLEKLLCALQLLSRFRVSRQRQAWHIVSVVLDVRLGLRQLLLGHGFHLCFPFLHKVINV